MFIKEMTMEGWKSYRDRTVMSGFDSYTAISGRNG